MPNKNALFGGCLDLGISKPDNYDLVASDLGRRGIDFVVLMEDRQPDFFLNFSRYDSESYVRLNRHGPHNNDYYPNQSDLKSFVRAFHDVGIEILYGFWVHENRWIRNRHPELLLTDSSGRQSQAGQLNQDFNPLLNLKKDKDYGIDEQEPFADYAFGQYSKLTNNFGFDGLFIGDGGLGFRVFGNDGIGLNTYDFSRNSISGFLSSEYYCNTSGHDCLLGKENLEMTSVIASDIWSFHQSQWIEWNCFQWSKLYKSLANHLHGLKQKLGAYSCMNYGPEEALTHGIDYKSIANSGIDVLIFQTYDYAWGSHFNLVNKDIVTNLQQLTSLNRYLGKSRIPKILFTAETGDSIEGWKCPLPKTLEQVRAYSGHMDPPDHNFTPITDGAFIVWLNETPTDDISKIIGNFATFPTFALSHSNA